MLISTITGHHGIAQWDNQNRTGLYGQRYQTRAEAKADLIEYIGYYNTERRHSAL